MTAPVVVASLVRCCVVCLGESFVALQVGTEQFKSPCPHCTDRVGLPIVVVPWRADTRRGAA